MIDLALRSGSLREVRMKYICLDYQEEDCMSSRPPEDRASWVADVIGYIESMKTYNAVSAEESGVVTEICHANGDSVDEDDVLIKMQ